jgi:hypothetical protein
LSVPTFAWAIEMGRVHRLCPDDRCLLMVLANLANLVDGRLACWPLLATLTVDTGLPKRTLIRSIERLEAVKLISTQPRGRGQTYYIERRLNGAKVAPNGSGNGAVVAPEKAANGAMQAPLISATEAPVEPRMVPNLHTTGAKSARLGHFPPTPPLLPLNQEEEPRREDPPLVPPQAGGKRGKPLPADWRPSSRSIALGFDLGMTQAEVLFEVEAMRDWASHKGETSLDWNARLNNWLRRSHRQKLPPQRLMQAKEAQHEERMDAFRQAHAAAKAREMVQ